MCRFSASPRSLHSFGDEFVGRGESSGGAFEEREVEKPVRALEFPSGVHESVMEIFKHLAPPRRALQPRDGVSRVGRGGLHPGEANRPHRRERLRCQSDLDAARPPTSRLRQGPTAWSFGGARVGNPVGDGKGLPQAIDSAGQVPLEHPA